MREPTPLEPRRRFRAAASPRSPPTSTPRSPPGSSTDPWSGSGCAADARRCRRSRAAPERGADRIARNSLTCRGARGLVRPRGQACCRRLMSIGWFAGGRAGIPSRASRRMQRHSWTRSGAARSTRCRRGIWRVACSGSWRCWICPRSRRSTHRWVGTASSRASCWRCGCTGAWSASTTGRSWRGHRGSFLWTISRRTACGCARTLRPRRCARTGESLPTVGHAVGRVS